jgi:hypothetical protein
MQIMRQRQIMVLALVALGMLMAAFYFSRSATSVANPNPSIPVVDTNTPIAGSSSGFTSAPLPSSTTMTASWLAATPTASTNIPTTASAQQTVSQPTSQTGNQALSSPTNTEAADNPLPFLMIVELQPESPMVGGQTVWVFNPSNAGVDLGCWALRSALSGNTVVVEPKLNVPAGTAAMLIPAESWLGVRDQIQLLDRSRRIVDQTPELRDELFDDQLWFRNASGQWTFGKTQIDASVIQGHVSTTAPPGC